MRRDISAKFLLAAAPPAVTIVPQGFVVKKISARVAAGARKPRLSGSGSAKPTSTVSGMADRSVIKGLAARGW